MLTAAVGCGRGPPAPTAVEAAPDSDAAAPELAGGPPPSLAPPAAPDSASSDQAAAEAPELAEAQPPAPASAPARTGPAAEIPDPLQRLNRPMFKVDAALHRSSLAKTSASLRSKPPRRVRQGIANALRNMDEPTTMANQVLQRHPVSALRTAARFVINSTLGLAGLIDVAKRLGLKRSHADFGQTLASYGVGPGAYLYVPIRGPTNVRDVVGAFADSYFWPLHWVRVAWFVQPAVVVARLEALPQRDQGFRYARARAAPGADPYLAARRAYVLKRDAEVHAQAPPEASPPEPMPVLAGAPRPTPPLRGASAVQLISARKPMPNPGL